MKRTILAALSALCLAGAALAEKADYPLTYTTFGTSGEVAVVVANTGSVPTLTLTDAAFARTITVAEGDERPINFNPTALTVTSVTLAFASQTAYSASFTLNGAAFENPTVGAAIAVPSSAGDRTVWPVTYTCAEAEGVRLETGTGYELDGLGQGLGGSQASYFTVDGVLHAEVVGTATLDRHVINVSDTMNLLTKLGTGFADTQDTVVVAEFGKAGGTLVMDRTLANAAFVAGSAATANAAVIQFVEGVTQTGPFTLRDDGEAQGRVILGGPTDAVWTPAAFLLRCDLTLRAPLPASLGAVTIPAGRTVRLELPEGAVFPDLRFGDAASRLELASKGTTIPAKYLGNDMGAAGVLALEQDVLASPIPVSVTFGGTGSIGTLELNGDHTFMFGTLVLVGEGAAFRQNGGTASVTRLTLNASATTIDVVGGTLTVGTVGGFATNTNVDLAVGPRGALTLNQGIDAGNDNSSLEITVAGTLVLGRDLDMTPAARRALTLDGGIIRAASAAKVVNGATGADAESENFMEVTANGGTLAGNLTVDGLRGPNGGTLTLDESVSVGTVLDYIGVIQGGKGIGQIAGSLGDVTLGDPWGGGDLEALATKIAADYRGTLGFTAGAGADAQKTIDFASVDGLTALPGAFRINDNQHIIMRLDQYADATIRWPDAPQGVTLTLIESGAYGGTVTLPHIPGLGEGVTLDFASFDASASGGWASRPPADFDVVSDESGVTDTLTWDDPVFTGEGAWIDVEFDGDTRNTGWFTLTDQDNATVDEDGRTTNGLLCGLPGGTEEGENPFGDKVMYGSISGHAAEDYFSEVRHPYNEKGGLALYYRPYVAMKSSLVYPETWSLSVRLTTPNAGYRCLIAFGNNDYTGNNPELDNCNALVLATGETDNEIVLYRFSGRRAIDGGAATAQPSEVLFRKTVADATSAAHTVSVVYDGETMAFYLDGAYIDATAPGALEGFRLGRGLQVGAQIGGQGVVPDAFWELAYPPSEAEGGVIDYIRFYKGALTDVAMQEIADRTPYVRENLRYVREVPAAEHTGPETWIQTGAWLEQTWNGTRWEDGETVDQPAEGAECRLLVDEGEHVIQVNVERQEGAYFYSPNRCYATLVVAPQEGATAAGTVRLTPLGVTTPETDTAAWEREIVGGTTEEGEAVEPSAWYATTATADAGNRTGFRYGRIRFTGGAGDPINDDPTIANFHGASYLLAGESSIGEGTSQTSERVYGEVTWDGEITWTFPESGNTADEVTSGKATQIGTRTYTYTVTEISGGATDVSPTHGIYDAGVCVFSKYANMVVETSGTPITTVTTVTGSQTVTRTADATCEAERHSILGVIVWYTPILSTAKDSGDWSEEYADNNDESVTDETTEVGEAGTVATHLRLVAGASLTRGERDEVVAWQLTGPVRVQGFEANTGDLSFVDGNTDGDPEVDETQASLDVWVPGFGADASWKFYDVTRKEAEANENGRGAGLFAQGIQTPGRLYLDLTQEDGAGTYVTTAGYFSKQAWYRYGYEGTPAGETRSGMEPAPISGTDFDNAVAFQIRLADGDATLVLDALPKAEIDTFFVEDSLPEGTEAKLPTLFLEGTAPLPIHRSVVAEARLDVSNGDSKTMALDLRPEGEPVPVHRGTSAQGALIVGNTTIDWDFGAISSVPRLEVAAGKTLTLEGGQDFRNYGNVLAAQVGATLAQRGASALLGTDVVLGEGAVFAFQAGQASSAENGVELTGALRLLGEKATLRGSNVEEGSGMPHFTALGGVVATNATLVVDAPNASDSWHSHTVALNGEGIGLTKTGAGTVDFYAEAAPTVSGPVRVEEGTLLVAKRDALADVPIGKHGLHVEKGATLGANARISGDTHFLAHLPSGATLSGGGTVEGGFVRLDPGACYEVKQDEALTATAGFSVTTQSEEATVQVRLPGNYEAGTVFLVAERREPDQAKGVPNVRRRLLSLKDDTTRWDTTARIENGATTKYAAQPPAFPVPVNPSTTPDGEHAYHKDVLDALLEHYHGENIAYVGASVGLTQAGNYRLNAAEISDALICFENIRHYGEASGAAPNDAGTTVEYVDGGSFYLAYEFGIAASAFATVGEQDYVVVKVELRNALGASFPELVGHEVATEPAAFRATTEVYLAWKGGDAVKDAKEVTDLTGATLGRAAAEGGLSAVRYFRVPYTEANFPADEARQLEARARLRPATTD